MADYPEPEDDRLGPFSRASSPWAYLRHAIVEVGEDPDMVYMTYGVRCTPPRVSGRDKLVQAAARACRPYLDKELEAVAPKAVLALGGGALYALTKQRGVAAKRGQLQQVFFGSHEVPIIPTFSPTAVTISPRLHTAFMSDVARWRRIGYGIDEKPELEIVEIDTRELLLSAARELRETYTSQLTFDLETRGFPDSRSTYSKVWSAHVTTGHRGPKGLRVFTWPLEHPEAPWFSDGPIDARASFYPQCREAVELLCDLVFDPGILVNGHNVKFDIRHLARMAERYGISIAR